MPERRIYTLRVAVVAVAAALLLSTGLCRAEGGKWSGVDETVVEKIAKEHGRQAHAPLIDPGNGDLQLFAFVIAGAVGGFAAGCYWRSIFKGKGE